MSAIHWIILADAVGILVIVVAALIADIWWRKL
jgi:hypothetical protein